MERGHNASDIYVLFARTGPVEEGQVTRCGANEVIHVPAFISAMERGANKACYYSPFASEADKHKQS